VINAYNKTN